MISREDLKEAIAECNGRRNPDANTCVKLAAYYTIREHLYPETVGQPAPAAPQLSFAAPADGTGRAVSFHGDTDFARMVDGKDAEKAWAVMDELMTALIAVNPRLYNWVMRDLKLI